VIVKAGITNEAMRAVSPVGADYEPLCADLAEGWTLCPLARLASTPARLLLVGQRFSYICKLCGYELPRGVCSCGRDPCICKGPHMDARDTPGELVIINATRREPWDRTYEHVLHYPRYYEAFEQGHGALDRGTLRALTERWDRIHRQRAAARSGPVGDWMRLNEIRSVVAHVKGALVPLADPSWDAERLDEGQLVLLTKGAAATASAAVDFVYRLPNLDVALRVEDVGENELIVSCGEQDLVRVEQYLLSRRGRPLRLTLDEQEADSQIKRERGSLQAAETATRLRELIGDPRLTRSTPERTPAEFFDTGLDSGQRAAVTAALAADELLVIQGPPGTGKTTTIAEIVRQHLARDPHTKILVASQTHVAVDNVLLRLTHEDPDLPIARLASEYTIDRVNQTIRERFWTESTEPWYPPTVRRAISYRQLVGAQSAAGDRSIDEVMAEVLEVQADYLASRGPQRTPKERLAQASVIGGTCASVQGSRELREFTFSLAILEEAGKARPPEALMVALRAPKTVYVGDTRQLPPHPWEPMQKVLRDPATLESDNEHLADQIEQARAAIAKLGPTPRERVAADQQTLFGHLAMRLHGSPHELRLRTQYRMLPEIGELVSQVFYGRAGGLQHARERPIDPRVQAFAEQVRVKLIDVPGQQETGPDGHSKHRGAEVEYVRRQLRSLNEHAANTGPPAHGPERLGVAVITPYSAQARRLGTELGIQRGEYPALNVRVGIVDSFQGDEDQVVILSIAATAAGFLKTPNRINVAVSRAQDLLILTTSLPLAIRDRIGKPLGDVVRYIDQRVKQHDPAYQIIRPEPPKPRRPRPPRQRTPGPRPPRQR
jgi:hypothetical protein